MNAIRDDNLIKGVDFKGKVKINLFAYDTLSTIEDPSNTMEQLKIQLNRLEELTGLSVNWNKL